MNTMPNTTQEYGKVIPLFNTPQSYIKPVPLKKPTLNDILYDFDKDINTRHDAEPFKDIEDINRILTHFLTQHNKSYNTAQRQPSRKWNPKYLRNYILFQIGLSCGLRASDLTRLQIGYFINENGTYRMTTEILEKKTSTTRKHRDTRTIYVNQTIIDALELYKKYHPNWTRQDYLFPNGYDENGRPTDDYITRRGFDHIVREAVKEINIQGRFATHSLRKSFAYHALQKLGNDDRGVKILQKILGHTDIESTYHYVGITQDEIKDTCMNLHLGFTNEDLMQRGLV